MRKQFLIFLSVISITAFSQQLKPLQVVDKGSADEVIIPFKKYKLSNGLTIILHEDRSDPMVHVDVTYHVGSAREKIGRSGFAHFFEHMMFQGSDHVGDDQHFKIIQEAGGVVNGTTTRDRTNYYETAPANQLERILWLEADRMGYFLDAVTQKKFEIQRATVKNERAQRYDNRPYGLVPEVVSQSLYPAGHPYSWLTIGYVEDLNKADLNDLKNFFLRWYGPNNATITIGGDIDPDQTLKWVHKYFGSIARGPEVSEDDVRIPELKETRYVTHIDEYATLPQVVITFPSVPLYHADMSALACLAEIIGQGKTSVFFQQLVKGKKAVNASASNTVYELSGEFALTATPMPEVSLVELYDAIQSALKTFEARGVTDDDIAKFKGAYEARVINGLQSISGKVAQLAEFETFAGDANMIRTLLAMNRAVTKKDVLRVYQKYVKDKSAVVLSVVPRKDAGNVVRPQNHVAEPPDLVAENRSSFQYKKGSDNFDRGKMPPVGKPVELHLPTYWRDSTDGVKLIGHINKELPLVALTISFPGGHLAQANDTTKVGLSRMLALMLNEDTKKRSAEEMQIELQKLGSTITVSTSTDRIIFNVSSLKKNLTATMTLLGERILEPAFTEEAFERHRGQTMELFKLRSSQATAIADKVFSEVNYGENHILAYEQIGTPASIRRLTLNDVLSLYDQTFQRVGINVTVAGDAHKDTVVKLLSFLKRVPAGQKKSVTVPDAPSVTKTKMYLVHLPGAAQTEIRAGRVTGMKFDATGEFYRAGLMNYLLGGSFTSRLNLKLREEKGWTYGARTVISGDQHTGTFMFYTSIKSEATDSAVVEVFKEMEHYSSSDVTNEELVFLKGSIGQREALRYETLGQKAAFLRTMIEYNLPPDFLKQQQRILEAMTAEDIKELAKNWVTTDHFNIVIVGDVEKIRPGLTRLPYQLVEMNP